MGYTLYMTRRPTWTTKGGPEISLAEWQAIVESDPELIKLPPTDVNPVWALIPSSRDPSAMAQTIFYNEGRLFVSRPIRSVLRKMLRIAQVLNARVVGEEDEVYSGDGIPDKETSFVPGDW
jgi:hypothetical protein